MRVFNFGPTSPEEAVIYAQQALRVDLQVLLHKIMLEAGTSEWQLSRRLGVSMSEVRKMFEDDWNPTVYEVAKVFHLAGKNLELL